MWPRRVARERREGFEGGGGRERSEGCEGRGKEGFEGEREGFEGGREGSEEGRELVPAETRRTVQS